MRTKKTFTNKRNKELTNILTKPTAISSENLSQRSKPYWTCIPEHQKISEHLKEKQKIICYLQNLRNLCDFLKTQQQAILPDIPLLHRIAPKIHSVVKTWKIASKPDIVQAPQDWKESLRKP